MRYKSYDTCDCKKQIKEIYESSFPKCERFPFWILKQCAKGNNARLYSIIDHKSNKCVGMQFIVNYDDITYLMYLAIEEHCRNKEYGKNTLKDLVVQNENVLLCIEKPSTNPDDIKLHRKNFYLRNGFHETGCVIIDSGVEYEFLSSIRGYTPTKEILEKRYRAMSNNPLIKTIIRHTFDVKINYVR